MQQNKSFKTVYRWAGFIKKKHDFLFFEEYFEAAWFAKQMY
jgi:hypothetical protein